MLLRQGGPAAASQRAVCERAGVTAPTLYHHFGDLSRLHALAMQQAFAEATGRKRSIQSLPLERLRQGWDAYVAFARDEPGVFRALASALADGRIPEEASASYELLIGDIRDLATTRCLRVAPELGAQMLWAAAHGAACLLLAQGEGSTASLSPELREAVLAAL